MQERITLDGGPGNDRFTFQAADPSTTYEIDRGTGANDSTGNDTATLTVSSVPAPDQSPYQNLSASVENLIIDGTQNASAVDWTVNGSTINAAPRGQSTSSSVQIVNSTGAGSVAFLGGTSNKDTLTVSGNNQAQPIQAIINGSKVNLSQGVSVLSQSQAAVSVQPSFPTVNGLTNANQAVTNADGTFAFASGANGSGVAIFRRNPQTARLTFVREYTLAGVSALAYSSKDDLLYVAHGSALDAYAIDPLTATLSPSYTPRANLLSGITIGELLFSPNNQYLLAIAASTDPSRPLVELEWGSGNRYAQVGYPIRLSSTVGQVTFSADSSEFFVPDSTGTITIYRSSDVNHVNQYDTTPSLYLPTANQVQVSRDGTMLMLYSSADSKFYYYSLPTSLNSGQMKLLGSIDASMSGWSNDPSMKEFAYLDSLGVLMILDQSQGTNPQPQIRSYLWNRGTSKFDLADSMNLVNAGGYAVTPRTLDASWSSTSEGIVALETVFHNSSNSTDTYDAENIIFGSNGSFLPGGTSYLPSVTSNTPLVIPIATLADPSNSGELLTVTEQTDNSLGFPIPTLQIFDVNGNFQSKTTFASSDTILGLAAGRSGDSPTSDLYVIYKDSNGAIRLRYYVLTNSANYYSFTNGLSGSDPTLNPGFTPDRVFVNAAGDKLFLANSSGNLASMPISSGVPQTSNLTLVDLQSILGYSLSEFAFAFGNDSANSIYAVSSGSPRIVQLQPSNNSHYAVLASVSNGAYGFTGEEAVVASSDNSILYAVTKDGQVHTYVLDPSLRIHAPATPVAIGSTGTFQVVSVPSTSGSWILANTTTGDVYSMVRNSGTYDNPSVGFIGTIPALSDVYASSVSYHPDVVLITQSDGENSLSSDEYVGTGRLYGPYSTIKQGDTRKITLSGLQTTSITSDAQFLYGFLPADGVFAAVDLADPSQSQYYARGVELARGLSGNLLITSSLVNGTPLGIVVSPADGTLTTFIGSAFATQLFSPDFRSATAITSDGQGTFYVATGSSVTSWSVDSSGKLTRIAQVSASGAVSLMRFSQGHLYVYSSATSTLSEYSPDLKPLGTPLGGLNSVTDLASTGTDLYATSSDQGGQLLHLIDQNNTLSLAPDSPYQGAYQGLSAPTSIALSTDGTELFVASAANDTIAAFSRDASTGNLTFLQSLTNGRGVSGFHNPTSLTVLGQTLYVASGQPQYGVSGGVARLSISPFTSAQPLQYASSFQHIQSLTVNGGSSFDSITESAAPGSTSVIINGGGGGDSVSLNSLGTGSTSVSFGTGLNQLDVNAGSANSGPLTIQAGTGQLTANINTLGTNTQATLDVSKGNTGSDIVNVAGAGLATGSSLSVTRNHHGTQRPRPDLQRIRNQRETRFQPHQWHDRLPESRHRLIHRTQHLRRLAAGLPPHSAPALHHPERPHLRGRLTHPLRP